MTTDSLKDIGFAPVATATNNNMSGGFCGDLLSWAMANAKEGDVWFTVMGNMNAVAVASLADVAAIVICQGVKLPKEVITKAIEEKIDIYATELPVYEAAVKYDRAFFSERQ